MVKSLCNPNIIRMFEYKIKRYEKYNGLEKNGI